MRLLLVLLALPIVCRAAPARVDGIPVSGRRGDVSVSDIRDAIRAVHDKVSRVEVLNPKRMHVYLNPRDLGWIAVRPDPFPKAGWPRWSCDGRGVDDPEVSQFIRSTDELYVFPVLTPDNPRRDNKHLRRLDEQARRVVVRLLSDHRSWYQGGYTLISTRPEPRNVGVLFRSGPGELVLFFSSSFTSYSGRIQGSFNGQHVEDMLEDNPGKKLEQWSHRFAPLELAATNRSNQTMQRTPTHRSPKITHD